MTTTAQAHTDAERRHDFVLLFDVQDGNPNGDPDAGNLPRVDPETTQGLVTDVSLKRKVRDWVDASGKDQARYKIYVQRESYLTETRAPGLRRTLGRAPGSPAHGSPAVDVRRILRHSHVRRGDEHAGIQRRPGAGTVAVDLRPLHRPDSPAGLQHSQGRPGARGEGPMGGGMTIWKHPPTGPWAARPPCPYALYLGYGFFNPHFAQQTGATSEDLELFWNALINMWDLDRSASRGLMACRGLYVFSHESSLGNSPAHRLFGPRQRPAERRSRSAQEVPGLHRDGGRNRPASVCRPDKTRRLSNCPARVPGNS